MSSDDCHDKYDKTNIHKEKIALEGLFNHSHSCNIVLQISVIFGGITIG